ncbi:MAG: sulfatase-like hydrolase/transferase [Pseudomonadota bacterium]
MQNPNFLFLCTDQLRADHLGCYGNAVVQTPHIDALAAQAHRYSRFYVASPSCQPNRAAMATGRMPSINGVRHNGIPLPEHATTFMHLLRDAGYATALIGKSHLQNMTGLPPFESYAPVKGLAAPSEDFQEAEIGRRVAPFYEIENERAWPTSAMERLGRPFYGFEHYEICTSHGDECGGDYTLWAHAQDPDFERLRDPVKTRAASPYAAPQARRTAIPEALYPSSYVAERTEAYLASRKGQDQPFFLQASFPDPHYPFTPPGSYFDMYDPADMALPESFGAADVPPMALGLRKLLASGNADREGHAPFAVTEREAREILGLTFGMITMIDDCVGRILAALDANGLADNTVVIFASDHGDYMGDYGIMLKGNLHSQGLTRVPFLWKEPGGDASVRHDLGSAIDIAPTILRRAGLSPNNGAQGRDLLDADAAPESLLIEGDDPGWSGPHGPPRTRTLQSHDWRLTVHQGRPGGELYHLPDDPGELCNLWDDPKFQSERHALTEALLRSVIAHQENAPLQTNIS